MVSYYIIMHGRQPLPRIILSGKDEERVAAFGMSLIDRRIPYRHYDDLTMDNVRFSQASKTWPEEVGDLRRITHKPFHQKTEEASAVLEVIGGHEERDARSVLLAHYLDELRWHTARATAGRRSPRT